MVALAAASRLSCTRELGRIQRPPAQIAVLSGGVWSSMSFIARVDSGVLIVDLGWAGAERSLRKGLAKLNAKPEDVRFVFLTHSHRDHVSGWRLFPNATFIMSAAESSAFVGAAPHHGVVTRWAEGLRRTDLPQPGEVHVRTFHSDTLFSFGRDTVHAYPVAGHTVGSAAYEFRHTLFIGDAMSMWPIVGFRGARRMYSDDADRSRESVLALWLRLPVSSTRTICVAHGKCVGDSDRLRHAALR